MEVRIDRERAAQFGLNTQQIAFLVRTAVNGTKASTYPRRRRRVRHHRAPEEGRPAEPRERAESDHSSRRPPDPARRRGRPQARRRFGQHHPKGSTASRDCVRQRSHGIQRPGDPGSPCRSGSPRFGLSFLRGLLDEVHRRERRPAGELRVSVHRLAGGRRSDSDDPDRAVQLAQRAADHHDCRGVEPDRRASRAACHPYAVRAFSRSSASSVSRASS